MNSSLIKGYRISPLRNSPFSGELGVEKVTKKKAREVKYIGKFQEWQSVAMLVILEKWIKVNIEKWLLFYSIEGGCLWF